MSRKYIGCQAVLTAGLALTSLVVWPTLARGDACCLPAGACQTVVDQAACDSLGGCWQGSGSSCTGRFCPVVSDGPTGACLTPTGSCTNGLTEMECLCLNGGAFEGPNFRYWAGPGTTCGNLPRTAFQGAGPQGGPPGGQINFSGATLFAPFFLSPASTNDWINADGDLIPCSNTSFSQFKDTNCSGGPPDFITGDVADQLAPSWNVVSPSCGQTWWGYWLFQYRSVGSVNGYTEFIDYQLLNRLPNSVPTEVGLINRSQWASGGAKTGPAAGCDAYCLAPAGSGDLDCNSKLDGRDIDEFVAVLDPGIADPSPCVPTPANTDYNGDGVTDLLDVPAFVACVLTGGCNPSNSSTTGVPGQTGAPVCPVSIDGSFLDVPSRWGTQGPAGTAFYNRKPNTSGYGRNFVASSTGFISNLASITRQKDPNSPPVSLNFNTSNPDGNTLFDTPVAFVPVVPIATQGVGPKFENLRFTQLQHLLVTGRMPDGENMVGATRDVGSGTRNAYNNALGIDPSWGMGDNEGRELPNENPTAQGPGGHLGYVVGGTNNVFHYSTNNGGSGIMERAVLNRRLAIGYTGLFGAGRAIADATGSGALYEILNTCQDIDGDGDGNIDSDCTPSACNTGTIPAPGCPSSPPSNNAPSNAGFVRPGIDTVIDNASPRCSYRVGAFGSFVTRGDIESGRNGNTNPPVANLRARDYLRNIKDSIAAFTLAPTDNGNFLSPAQYLATNFTLLQGLDNEQSLANPTQFTPQPVNQPVQDVIRCTTTQITPAYAVASCANRVPQRVNQNPNGPFAGYPGGPAYSDGSVNGQYAYNGDTFAAASKLSGNGNLNQRNEVMGDFDYTFDADPALNQQKKRNLNDIDEMMVAVCNPRQFERSGGVSTNWGGCQGAMAGGDFVIPEIIGDFTGDGNFDSADVRYFADGLAMDPATGNLDRKQGFTLVDTNWSTTTCGAGSVNYFGTLLKTRKSYVAGDSRGDVAGGSAPIAGASPVGADGCIDGDDIDYVYQNFISSWADLTQSINTVTQRRKDLSCDIDGDLDVDQADVDELVQVVLCTAYGDADLDGDVDGTDFATVNGNLGQPGGWAQGDFNGNNVIDVSDVTLASGSFTSSCVPLNATPCP